MTNLRRLPPLALAALGAAAIALWLFLAWRQISYPLELYGHEGAIVDHVRRVLQGQPIYGAPEIEFVPFLYTPAYYYLVAALAWAGDLAFVVPRSVSVAATIVSIVCLYLLTQRLSGSRSWGIVAAAGLALGASRVEAWYALAQVDNVFLALLAIAITVGVFARTVRGFFVVGLIFAASFWCKQIGLAAGLIHALALLLLGWRLAFALALGLAVGILPLLAVIAWNTDGWFLYYAFEIPANYGIHPLGFVPVLVRDTPWLLPAYAAAAFLLVRLWRAGDRDLVWRLLALALTLYGTAVIGRSHPGGHVNTLLPAIWLMALALGAAMGMLWKRIASPGALAIVAGLALLQMALLAYNPQRYLPAPNGARVLAEIRARLGEAPQPILLGGVGYLTGRVAGADHVAVNDVLRTDPNHAADFLRQLESAMREKRYKTVVVEEFLARRYASLYEPYYRSLGPLHPDGDAQRPRAGFDYGSLCILQAR